MLCNAIGGEGSRISVTKVYGPTLLVLQAGGGCQISRQKTLRNTWLTPNYLGQVSTISTSQVHYVSIVWTKPTSFERIAQTFRHSSGSLKAEVCHCSILPFSTMCGQRSLWDGWLTVRTLEHAHRLIHFFLPNVHRKSNFAFVETCESAHLCTFYVNTIHIMFALEHFRNCRCSFWKAWT